MTQYLSHLYRARACVCINNSKSVRQRLPIWWPTNKTLERFSPPQKKNLKISEIIIKPKQQKMKNVVKSFSKILITHSIRWKCKQFQMRWATTCRSYTSNNSHIHPIHGAASSSSHPAACCQVWPTFKAVSHLQFHWFTHCLASWLTGCLNGL